MHALTHILTVTIKELRELLHRPMLVLTLVLGPLAILIVFGLGSDATPNPPRAIVVMPPGEDEPRLLQEYQQQFEASLVVTEYTNDEPYARAKLRSKAVDAVLVLPPTPFKTITSGKSATIKVLYNEIDPLWRGLVPQFVRALASEINRQIFLETAGEQQVVLSDAVHDLDTLIGGLDTAITAMEGGDWQNAQQEVQEALSITDRLAEAVKPLGPQATPLQAQIERIRTRLQEADRVLRAIGSAGATPSTNGMGTQLDLQQTRSSLQALRDAITSYTAVPPEVVIAPLAVETELVARLTPDFLTFFAPTVLALLVQHIAVSLGALALVRERLAGTFDLYAIAPISHLALLVGKYVAYTCFTLVIAAILLGVLLLGLDVPVFGSVWRLALTLVLLALASVGLGFALSLLAASERQAVQFSMLSLLSIVFFSGFVLPLDTLRQPAISVSYAMPATYGVVLLQDVMLRGLPGSNRLLLALGAIAIGVFLACLGLLHWRTRAR